MALPVLQKIVTLIWRCQAVDLLKGAPMRFRKGQIVEDLHTLNAPVGRAQAASDNRLRAYGYDVHGCKAANSARASQRFLNKQLG